MLLIAGIILALAAAVPVNAAPSLRVSPDARYLQRQDGKPFLWVGDTAWALFYKLDREDVRAYLDDRQSKGFNVIQAVAYWYPHGEDGPGPHNAPNAYGHRPFAGEADEPDTSQTLTARGGSPDAPNDYWDHADFIVREVRRRGLYLALLPCWGRAFVNAAMPKSRVTIDEASARSFGRFLGERYGSEPHIVWVLGGDINPTKGVGDRRSVYRAMAEGIGQGVTGTKLVWNRPDPKWGRMLMTYHPEGDPRIGSSEYFHGDAWLDMHGIETWKWVDQVNAAVARDRALSDPVRPVLFLEGAYEGGRYAAPGGPISALKARRQAWQAMLAGAAGHTYGAGPVWHFQRMPREGVEADQWKRAIQYPGAEQVAKVLHGILTELRWWALAPDQSIILSGAGEGELSKVAARSADGRRIVVYFADASQAELFVPLGSRATWIDVRDGRRIPAESGRAFRPPAGLEDALIVIERP